MSTPRLDRRTAVIGLLAAATTPWAMAQADTAGNYPAKTLKMVVPYSPGSVTDTLARMVSERLSQRLGQPVIVENRPGASGQIGTAAVAAAGPDGYTMMLAPPTHIINSVLRKMPYDPIRNFDPVIQIARSNLVLVVNAATPANNLKELVSYLKAQGDNATYASAGQASTLHLYTAQLQQVLGTSMRHVPSKGLPGAIMDVVQNSVTVVLAPMENAVRLIKSGHLKAMAQTGRSRFAEIPDVPTFAEAGLSSVQSELWYGLFLPAGTPKPILAKLNREVAAVLAMPEVKTQLLTAGTEPVGGSPEQLAALCRSELAMWADVVKRNGIKAD